MTERRNFMFNREEWSSRIMILDVNIFGFTQFIKSTAILLGFGHSARAALRFEHRFSRKLMKIETTLKLESRSKLHQVWNLNFKLIIKLNMFWLMAFN